MSVSPDIYFLIMPEPSLSKELRVLIDAAVKTSPGGIPAALSDEIDWIRLMRLAGWHQVRPLLFEYLSAGPVTGAGIGHFQKLREFTFGQAVTNMAFAGVSVQLYQLLTANQVRTFLMKGALWAWMLYEKPASREFGDIDYFMHQDDVRKSVSLLSEKGFYPDNYRKYLLAGSSLSEAYLATDYQLPLEPITENTLQSLEVQWQISYPRYRFDMSWTELGNEMINFEILNTRIKVPRMENQLLMMVIHHGGVEQWDKLKYVADFVRLLRSSAGSLDWNYINSITRQKGFYRLLQESVGLANFVSGEDYLHCLDDHHPEQFPSPVFLRQTIAHWENARPILKTKSWRIFLYNMKYRDTFKCRLDIVFAHLNYLASFRLLWHKAAWYRKNRF